MHHQKSVAELAELEASVRPDFQRALAHFKASTKYYDSIKEDLQKAIKFTLKEYCKLFGALDQRACQLAAKERPFIQQIAHNPISLIDFVDVLDDVDDILDVSDPSQDLNRSGFSVFYWVNRDSFGRDEDMQVVIPTRYLAVDGFRLMQEEADRISAEISHLESSHLAKKAQLKEARERAEFERLKRKFS